MPHWIFCLQNFLGFLDGGAVDVEAMVEDESASEKLISQVQIHLAQEQLIRICLYRTAHPTPASVL